MATKAKKSSKKSASKMIEEAKKQLSKGGAIVKTVMAKPVRYKATKEEAQSLTSVIREKYQTMGKTWWELGEKIREAVDKQVPAALGISFSVWAESCFGEGWLKMRRAFLSVKALKGVPMEKLQKISEGNAYTLSHLPEKTRQNPDWIKKASELTNEKFREAAERYIAKKTGIKDPMLKIADVLKVNTIPKSLFEVMKVTMKMAAEIFNADLDTKEGRIAAIEGIFAEFQLNNKDHQPELEGKPDGKIQEVADTEL